MRTNSREWVYRVGLLASFAILAGCVRHPINAGAISSAPAASLAASHDAPVLLSISPDGKWAAMYNLNHPDSRVQNIANGSETTLPPPYKFTLEAVAYPWSRDSRFLLLCDRTNTQSASFLLWNVATKEKTTLSLNTVADGACALLSPDGRYMAAGVVSTRTKELVDDLVLWEIGRRKGSQYQIMAFPGSVSAVSWMDEKRLLVNTVLRRNEKIIHEIYLVDAPGQSKRRVGSFQNYLSMAPAPYADSTGLLLLLARQAAQTALVRFDPGSGKLIEIARLPRDPLTLVWSRPDTIYLWRRPDKVTVEVRTYDPRTHSLGVPRKVETFLQPTADSSGHLWGIKDGRPVRD